MPSKMHIEQTFPCSADHLVSLLSDDDFDVFLMDAVNIGREQLEAEETPEGPKRRLRLSPPTKVPAFMSKMVKATHYDEVRHWNRDARTCAWQIEPAFSPDKVSISGQDRVEDDGAGGCKRIVDGDFEVKVRLLGGQIEKFIISQTEATFAQIEKVIRKHLADNPPA